MKDTDKAFAGSIPTLYDRHLGSCLFEPYAADLAKRAVAFKPTKILETAAGTGIVTRALIRALPAHVSITATDLNEGMLDVAAAILKAPNVEWRQADALALPFADGAFDLAVCQFGAMFFPDKAVAYREALRVLETGGHFLFNIWDRIEQNEFSHVVSDAVADFFPNNPPRFLARTPFGYHDVAVIKRELREAGFRESAVETVQFRSRAASAGSPAIGYCQGSPLRFEIEARDESALEKVTAAAAAALEKRFGAGPIEGRMQALVFVATK